MLDQSFVYQCFEECGVHFFTGVPDSYLNAFCDYLVKYVDDSCNMIAANEGNAIGIASGHYLATRELPLVYMQNSGLGNAVNPLVSLADQHVYAIPMILLIGWRGQPGMADWPQHRLQGEITTSLLDDMHIPYKKAEDDMEIFKKTVKWASDTALRIRRATAIVVPSGILSGDKTLEWDEEVPMGRGEAMEIIMDHMPESTIYAATTGRTARELFYLREKRHEDHGHDFLNVGSMGHVSSVALGLAMEQRDRQIVCLDGDASAIMHLGAMTMASKYDVPNFLHIVLNNGSHDSVGGQPSAGQIIDFTGIARACGYFTIGKSVESKEELAAALKLAEDEPKASFLDVRIHKGARTGIPPLDVSYRDAIDSLINELHGSGGIERL